jgi:glycosyltransferase involved in cell wall biosynthesis
MGFSICRVTDVIYPDAIGGHAIFCHELSERQAKTGNRIQVFTARKKSLPRTESIAAGYNVTRLDRVWMPWDYVGMYNPVTPSLYGAVARPNWDLVDAHSHLFWMTALSVRAAVTTGKPSVTTVHGFMALRDWLTNMSQKAYLLSVGAWVLRKSTRVVCLTESDASQVANLGVSRRNISVIPSAVEPNRYRRRDLTRTSIIWVGRLVAEKGLDTLVEAVSKIRKRSRLRLMLVGDGPKRNELIGLVRKLNLADIVTFRLKANRDEIAKLLSEAEVFALPSLKEGLPLALLEAMASETTVVASDIPSIREVLDGSGLFFSPGNAEELAQRLQMVLDDCELRKRKGRLAREIVEKRFSWDAVLPKLDDLYGEVAGP